jgi:hypothetical protein
MYRFIPPLLIVQLIVPATVLAQKRAPDQNRPKLVAHAYGHHPVYAPPPPSTGVGHIVTGSIFVGVGALNLLTAPLCRVDDVIPDPETQDTCLYASLIVGGVFLAVGIPLLVIGIGKRRAYKRWLMRHPVASQLLTGMKVAVGQETKGVSWELRF